MGGTIGEKGGRCAGKREKAEEALRYALISAQEPRKIRREKHEKAGAIVEEKEGAQHNFQSHFSRSFFGNFFKACFRGPLGSKDVF